MHVGQTSLNAVVIETQSLMIESQQVQRGRVQIIRVTRMFSRFEAERIAGAVTGATTNASSGHPSGEDAGVVVATFLSTLHEGLPTELRRANDER